MVLGGTGGGARGKCLCPWTCSSPHRVPACRDYPELAHKKRPGSRPGAVFKSRRALSGFAASRKVSRFPNQPETQAWPVIDWSVSVAEAAAGTVRAVVPAPATNDTEFGPAAG